MIQITGKIAYENPSEYTQIYGMWDSGDGKSIANKYKADKCTSILIYGLYKFQISGKIAYQNLSEYTQIFDGVKEK